jgi:hypothetical protein
MQGQRKLLSEVIHRCLSSQNNIGLLKSKNASLTGHSEEIHKNAAAHDTLYGKSKLLEDQGVSLRVTFTIKIRFKIGVRYMVD